VRLTLKIVSLFVVVVAIVLAISARAQYRREAMMFDRDLRRDAGFAAVIVAHDVETTWRHEGLVAALALLDDPHLQSGGASAAWVGDLAQAPAALRDRPDGVPWSIRRGRVLETWTPVRSPDGTYGAIVLRHPLTEEDAYVAASLRRAIVTALALAALSILVSLVLGVLVIGRPGQRLVSKVRRIAAGDLAGPLQMRQRDEIGEVAREIDAMCDRMAAARVQLEAEIEQRIAAVEQLRHADRLMTVGKLAAGVAHELGTPMNVISGRAQMIVAGECGVEGPEGSARVIVTQTKKMTQIIRQLLDFARRGRGSRVEQPVASSVQRAITLLAAMARKAGVELGAGRIVDAPAVIDDAQIEQVATNLIVNALHATSPGGHVTCMVEVVEAAPPGGGAPARWVRLRVADDGRGMDGPTRERMFEPFFTTKDVGEGTGLGLAVVWGIVTDHGGWIDVESAPGAGTAVSVHVPAV